MEQVTGRVAGKVALVTGGASGLGYAIVRRLIEEGATTIMTDIQEGMGQKAASGLGAGFVPQDVSDEQQWRDILKAVFDQYGRLDILVNNAGISGPLTHSDPETTRLEDWRKIQEVNAQGVFLGCKHALGYMRRSGGGSIINLSSIAALVATPFITAYGASKAAVRQLTMSVAMHGATTGARVRCNSVHPGQIRTPMLENLFEESGKLMGVAAEEVEQQFLSRIPLGEFGEPEDIAHMVLFLASDESKHITGGQFVVDGGMQLNG
ncbi:glucose 1-dehydrogenase [Luteithermobacter gelatinilyticus]|uniref:glucose 1-dehydrogenase n=1 Tax=Luteithermobacter gelatinilyticus TaxID=2582913 RepID=UPI001106B0B5|nr:glucose 1-dehydrogenase [Luteithermobacter gelatinilyticus]